MTRTVVVALQAMLATTQVGAQGVPTWALAPELSIGAIDDPLYALSRVLDLDIDANGRIFVAQPMDNQVRVFDRDGRAVMALGRQGDGPGEFRSIFRLHIVNGTLAVVDQAQLTLTEFTTKGEYVRTWTALNYTPAAPLTRIAPSARLADGTLIGIPGYVVGAEPRSVELPILQFDTSGKFVRQLAILRAGGEQRRARAGNLMSVLPQPVSFNSLWAVHPNGQEIVVVHRFPGSADRPGRFHVVRLNTAGDTTLSKSYRVPVIRVNPSALEDTIARLAAVISRTRPFPAEQIAALYRDGWRVPEYQAPVDRLLIGRDGYVWVRQGSFLEARAHWWVFDRSGTRIANVIVPSTIQVMRVGRDHAWGTQLGEHDVDYVVRMRIVR